MIEEPMTPAGTVFERERPDPPEARAALVSRWLADIATARKHWGPDFTRMRRNQQFAAGKQWPGQKADDERYRVNLVQRVLKATVAALYAKNPTVTHKRRPRLDFRLWDGRAETLAEAQMAVQAVAKLAVDPEAAATPEGQSAMMIAAQAKALLADVQEGMARRQMIDKVGKTLVAVSTYYINEGDATFKLQMKQMVRRARTTAVGYVKLGFQREMELSPDQSAKIADHADRLAVIGRLSADLADGEIDPNAAAAEELRLAMAAIQAEPSKIVREGAVFSFPAATRLIPSMSTQKLMGWVGAEWIAEEIMLSPDRIKEVYGVDIGTSFSAYKTVGGAPLGGETRRVSAKNGGLACVYEVYDKTTGLKLVVCEGYPDFLQEPASPEVFIEQFFPYFAVTFNDCEEEGRLFPDSDVENMTHPQREFNRTKEAVRQHRIANRPLYVSPKGAFEEEEKKALSNYAAHDVIELNGLKEGRPATDLLMPVPKIGVDPNLYETNSVFEDMQRVTGNAEAHLGGTGGATATENSIAESSRQGVLGLDGDDLDDMLSAFFRALGQVLLDELDAATVMEIVGPGAVWPELSREEISKELWLDIEGGSSGRPNAAQEAAVFERLYPLLVQTPGVTPGYLAKKALTILDSNVDLEEAFTEGLPSIASMNRPAPMGAGGPDDPANQGGEGGNNAPRPKQRRDNGQPGYTPPSN